MKIQKIYEKIKCYSYVSFDIFDTLVLRNVSCPEDVFSIVEYRMQKKYKNNNFRKIRIAAESEARRNIDGEITLDDIYLRMPYSVEQITAFKKCEIDTEITVCTANVEMMPLLRKLDEEGISYFLISDMYLPEEVINEILDVCGIKRYKKLFLSSTYGERKRTSRLYKQYMVEVGIQNGHGLHIGDDLKADVIAARMAGLSSYYYRKKSMKKYHTVCANDIFSNVSKNMIINYLRDESPDFFFKLGYSYYGPLLFSFVVWIDKKIKENHIQTVLFLARDGYIIKQAYEYLFADSCESKYFYVSKKSIFAHRLEDDYSLDNVLKNIDFKEQMTVEQLLHSIQYEGDYLRDKKDIISQKIFNNCADRKWLENILKIKREEFGKEARIFSLYTKQFDDSKCAVIDVGWNGTIQHQIDRVMNQKTLGLYLGLNKDRIKSVDAESYFLDDSSTDSERKKIRISRGILELFFSSDHGTTLTYKVDKEGNITPVLDQNFHTPSYKREKNVLNSMQVGALQFVKDYSTILLSLDLPYELVFSIDDVNQINKRCNSYVLEKIGDIIISEKKQKYLAKPRAWFEYLKSPEKIKRDFGEATWKIGFMRRLMHNIPFPYETIYFYLISLFGIEC